MASDLDDVKEALKAISLGQTKLLSAVETVSQRVAELEKAREDERRRPSGPVSDGLKRTVTPLAGGFTPSPAAVMPAEAGTQSPPPSAASSEFKSSFSSRVVLTTYPKQIGIKPLPMEWGAADPLERGPVTVSRSPSTIGRRNAIGAHGGSYSVYYALALASRELKADHRPDFTNTEPAASIGPFPQWTDKKKIVAMDPWGHLVPWLYKDIIQKDNGMFAHQHPAAVRLLTLSGFNLSGPPADDCHHQGAHEVTRTRGERPKRAAGSGRQSVPQRTGRAQRDQVCRGAGLVSSGCGGAVWHRRGNAAEVALRAHWRHVSRSEQLPTKRETMQPAVRD